MARAVPPDLTRWLIEHLRREFPAARVGNREPPDLAAVLPLRAPLIVVRDDGGPRRDWLLWERSVGVSVLGGSRADASAVDALAREVAGVLWDDGLVLVPGSPVTRVEWAGCTGPLAVAERADVARRYLLAQYVVASPGW